MTSVLASVANKENYVPLTAKSKELRESKIRSVLSDFDCEGN